MALKHLAIQSTVAKKIILQFTYLTLLLSLCRIIFHFYNKDYFHFKHATDMLYFYIIGIRFDIVTIIYFSLFYILFNFISIAFTESNKNIDRLINLSFIFSAIFIICVNLIDCGYYRFVSNRISRNSIKLLQDSWHALVNLLPRFWLLILISIVVISTFIGGNYLIIKNAKKKYNNKVSKQKQFIELTVIAAAFFVFARGLNTFPLSPGSANMYVKPNYVPFVNNSAFNLLFTTIRNGNEVPVPDFSLIDTQRINTDSILYQHFQKTGDFKKKNVIIFIMESLSPGYLQNGHPHKAHTPFLDSIIKKSMVCTNAYSNGAMSIVGINSVVGSIPPIAYQTIINSPYQNNIRHGIGSIFEEKGYSTHFFFGGNDDHYGFKRLVRQFGITNYYSQKTFNNDKFYDGNWGIYDMPFMQYAAATLKKEKAPFLSIIFNLSTHYPFAVPEPYKSSLPEGPLISSQSISYLDLSIERFFDAVKLESWFNNTLFVFVADHQSYGDGNKTFGINGYSVPLFYYTPDESLRPGKFEHVTDHLSILPSVLDILDYSGKFISNGRSIFKKADTDNFSCSIAYFPDVIQITNDSLNLQFDIRQNKKKQLFRYKTDPQLMHNLLDSTAYQKDALALEVQLKKYLYEYYRGITVVR